MSCICTYFKEQGLPCLPCIRNAEAGPASCHVLCFIDNAEAEPALSQVFDSHTTHKQALLDMYGATCQLPHMNAQLLDFTCTG